MTLSGRGHDPIKSELATVAVGQGANRLSADFRIGVLEKSGERFIFGRVATKELLIAISHDLENQALRSSDDGPVLLGAFQTAPRFTEATHARYERLADACVFVGAVGIGLGVTPARGVRGGSLTLTDRLAGEWTVTVLTPHHASALIARDLGDGGPDRQRRFEYAITHDRALVALAARSLLYRIVATA